MTTLERLKALREFNTRLGASGVTACGQIAILSQILIEEREQTTVKENLTTQPPVDSVGEKIERLLAIQSVVSIAKESNRYSITAGYGNYVWGKYVWGKTLSEALDAALAKVAGGGTQ